MTYFKVFEGRELISSVLKAYLFKMYVWGVSGVYKSCLYLRAYASGVCIRAYASGRMHRGVCIGAYASGRMHWGMCTVGAGIEDTYIEATCIEGARIRVRIPRNNVIRHCARLKRDGRHRYRASAGSRDQKEGSARIW
jgi:hypothetical protein